MRQVSLEVTRRRFRSLVREDDESGCWLWCGTLNRKGYGYFGGHGAHRLAYEWFVGPIPAGLQIDHLCRTRHCVNPAHLEAVTLQENVRRGGVGAATAARQRAKTHCPTGHAYDEGNTYFTPKGHRRCVKCRHIAQAKTYQKNKRLRAAVFEAIYGIPVTVVRP